MADINIRKLPAGIQSFKTIREEGYVYVDKSNIVWYLANCGKLFNYLSRPRRFGKSILVDTLQMYFEGRKELFEGLKIMQLEKEWKQYPVIRLDLSRGGANAETLRSYLDLRFKEYEKKYAITLPSTAHLADRFDAIITTAYKQTGLKVAILIDEYDSPLQHSWKTPEHEKCTEVYREVFAILKADDEYERLVFITGITKFTQISLFSVLNNLTNISFLPEYAAICGITEEEIGENFKPELERMNIRNKWTAQETHDHLKEYYDGYHFTAKSEGIYNPYSIINAMDDKTFNNYWFASGTPTFLIELLHKKGIDMLQLDEIWASESRFNVPTDKITDPIPVLYQSGYLTIKDYNEDTKQYLLGFPNEEVRQGFSALFR